MPLELTPCCESMDWRRGALLCCPEASAGSSCNALALMLRDGLPDMPASTDGMLALATPEDERLRSANDLLPASDALPTRCLVISCRAESWVLLLDRALLEPASLLLPPLLTCSLPAGLAPPLDFVGLGIGLRLGLMLGLFATGPSGTPVDCPLSLHIQQTRDDNCLLSVVQKGAPENLALVSNCAHVRVWHHLTMKLYMRFCQP